MDHLDDIDRRSLRGADRRILSALYAGGRDPHVATAARALSRVGEHGTLWLAAGLAGAVVDRGRRGAWLRGTALTAGAHLASMGVKRAVSYTHLAAAAAVAFGALGAYAVAPLAAAMCVSRLVVGVHYPSDVAAGVALGALTARAGSRWMRKGDAHG